MVRRQVSWLAGRCLRPAFPVARWPSSSAGSPPTVAGSASALSQRGSHRIPFFPWTDPGHGHRHTGGKAVVAAVGCQSESGRRPSWNGGHVVSPGDEGCAACSRAKAATWPYQVRSTSGSPSSPRGLRRRMPACLNEHNSDCASAKPVAQAKNRMMARNPANATSMPPMRMVRRCSRSRRSVLVATS